METWDAITARRNVRDYKLDPISDDDLNRIVEAGWRAPSAKNRQAWDFVIVTDKDHLQELSTVWQGAGHIAGAAAAMLDWDGRSATVAELSGAREHVRRIMNGLDCSPGRARCSRD